MACRGKRKGACGSARGEEVSREGMREEVNVASDNDDSDDSDDSDGNDTDSGGAKTEEDNLHSRMNPSTPLAASQSEGMGRGDGMSVSSVRHT
mmetsp:Transcript_22114/g.39392  ORF Transcript_22114/g.39392 Transcript_22114/m.39392 type:complete len:93 (+) Transcript_22114:538-816(+)